MHVDHHLLPLITKIPSYLNDITDFLQKLLSLGPLPQGCILVTLVVSSLYTNIPHNEGIEACQRALETRPSPAPPTSYLTRMIELILKLNNFSFNEEHYLQVQGTAMGTRVAPSYANLFMAKLEEDLLAWTSARPHTWWRYIDDIFAIWEHGREPGPNQLISSFHQIHRRNLYTTVILEGNNIHTDLYTKPTDTHQYLSPDSCHPKHCTL